MLPVVADLHPPLVAHVFCFCHVPAVLEYLCMTLLLMIVVIHQVFRVMVRRVRVRVRVCVMCSGPDKPSGERGA